MTVSPAPCAMDMEQDTKKKDTWETKNTTFNKANYEKRVHTKIQGNFSKRL